MYEFVEYQVADAMTYRPVTVRPDATLAQVEAVFEAHDHECLPVCDQDGRLVGVVTKFDFLQAFAFTPETMVPRYRDIMARTARSVMCDEPIVVHQDTPLTRVLQLMVRTRHKSFPVTLGNLLLGMVSRRDVLRALRRAASGQQARNVEQPQA